MAQVRRGLIHRPTAPASQSPGEQSASGSKRIAVSDVAGYWTHSTSSYADYVSSSTGAYAGSSTIAYGQGYDFASDGTYKYNFTGMWNSVYVKEKDSGAWAFENNNLVLRSKERPGHVETYQIIEYQQAPDGTTFMTLLEEYYPPTEGNIGLYGKKFVRAAKKPESK